MRLDRRAVLRIGGVSLAGIVAGCADQGGDTNTNETDSPAETDETTTEQGGLLTETDTETTEMSTETETTTEMETETPDGTTTETPSGTPTTEPDGTVVEMQGTEFVPMEVSVDPGTEVRWVNNDGIPHDVTSAQFNDGATQWEFSERASPDEEVTYTFEEAGTYEYYCSIHGQSVMCGVVLVGDTSRAGTLPCE